MSPIVLPTWTATVDGEAVELGRVNYILRAIHIQPGQHQVELAFFPKSVDMTETIAYIAFVLLLLILIFVVVSQFRQRK